MELKLGKNKEGNGYDLIEKAASILHAKGEKQKAEEIHQKATTKGYNFYFCLKLLKEYDV
jgi:hypothetical protein